MKQLLLISLLLSGVICLSGQSTKVNWGPTYKLNKSFGKYKFLGIQDDNYFMVLRPDRENIIRAYGLKHNLVSEVEFNHKRNKEQLKINGAVRTKSGTYIYLHQLNEKHKEWLIHTSQYQGGQFAEPTEAYFHEIDIEKKRLTQAFQFYNYQYGEVDGGLVVSEDSTKVAFINHISRTRKNGDDALVIAVFDDKMRLLWKDVFFYQFGEKWGTIEQKTVTNDGEIFLVANVSREKFTGTLKKRNYKNLPSSDYMIYHVNQEGILENKIDLGKNIAPVDVGLFFPNNNTDQYLMAGFYTTDEFSSNRVNGLFFAYGDKEFSDGEIKIHQFEDEFLKDLATKREIKKGKGIDTKFAIKDLLEFKDGTIGFIAEETLTRTYYNNNNWGAGTNFGATANGRTQETRYFTNDIIIPKFDKEGNLLNIEKIDKEFASRSKFNTSYSLALNKGKAYLVFNDYKERKEAKEIKKKGRRFTDLVVIDSNGKIEHRETLFSNREIDLEFTTNFSSYNDKVMLIGSMSGKKYSMGTISFNN